MKFIPSLHPAVALVAMKSTSIRRDAAPRVTSKNNATGRRHVAVIQNAILAERSRCCAIFAHGINAGVPGLGMDLASNAGMSPRDARAAIDATLAAKKARDFEAARQTGNSSDIATLVKIAQEAYQFSGGRK